MFANLLRGARLLVPALLLVLAGCFPTSSPERKPAAEDESATACPLCARGEKPGEDDCCAPAPETKGEVTLKVVKYDGLTEAIRAHRGKVVVLDVWASWCLPCKQEFPHLVELHRTYAADGLVCISVSVDDTKEREAAALSFLQKQKATFPNYRLDEEGDFLNDKWDFKGIPVVLVFDRDGKRAATFTNDDPDNQFEYDRDVVPLVRKLLKSEPPKSK
jgi:thiol-disulfide isomerase/thioredoxin